MATIDCFTYNGERDMLALHLDILDKYVDRFVIVESKRTFTGNKKPLYFFSQEKYFKKYWKKIDYFVIPENFTEEEIALANSSPNTQGAAHLKEEFLQKESIKKALKDLRDDDKVFIGDVDEIWDFYEEDEVAKLKLRVYAYWLNNRSNEEFWGTLMAPWGQIKNECLNHLRSDVRLRTKGFHGWHFTNMGGIKEVRRKLNDSYTEESYNTKQVQQLLKARIDNGVDYLGRPFQFNLDESEWPIELKENRERYQHLTKTP